MNSPTKTTDDFIYDSLKIALNIIPGIGGSAAELFGVLVTSPLEKRRIEWMELLTKRLILLEENQKGILSKLLNNEEFTTLLGSASINAIKTHAKEKRTLLLNALINYEKSTLAFDNQEIYLGFISSLTIPHLIVLKFIRDFEDRITSVDEIQKVYNILMDGNSGSDVPQMEKMEVSNFRFLLKDLESKGLLFMSSELKELSGNIYESSSLESQNNSTKELPYLKITTFGKEFLCYIQEEVK